MLPIRPTTGAPATARRRHNGVSMHTHPLIRGALSAAIAAATLAGTSTVASAQSVTQRAEERRAARQAEAENPAESSKAAPTFPSATRDEPVARASARLTPLLDRLFAAYESDDVAAAKTLTDEIAADERANAYEKGVSARIYGSMLLASDGQQAATLLQRAVDSNGLSNNEHYEALFLVAQLQVQDERYEDGLRTLETFLSETSSTDPQHLVMKGSALYQLQRYDEAIAVLEPAIASATPPRADWTQLLMGAYADAGRPADAARLAERVAEITPGDRRAQLNLAATYLQSEQLEKAAEVYERLRASGELTEDRDYRNLIALYANAEGKEAQTIAAINEGFEKGILTPDAQAYTALGQAYFFSDQTAPAIDAYQKAAPLADNGEAYLNLAKILANEGRAAESKAAAQQALDKGIRNPDEAKSLIAR